MGRRSEEPPEVDVDRDLLPPIDWDAQPFGRVTDTVIAGHLCVTAGAVGFQRLKRGIPSADIWKKDSEIDWGNLPWTETNAEIARRIGVSRVRVAKHRPADKPSPNIIRHDIDWSALPWATETNYQIGKTLGINRVVVSKYRPSDVPSPSRRSKKPIDWKCIDWSLTNSQIARALGVASDLVGAHRPAELKTRTCRPVDVDVWANQPWATESNRAIAERLGVSWRCVHDHRPVDIPPPSQRPTDHAARQLKVWETRRGNVDWDSQPFGKESDAAIGRQLGRSPSAVSAQRIRRGIPAAYPGRGTKP